MSSGQNQCAVAGFLSSQLRSVPARGAEYFGLVRPAKLEETDMLNTRPKFIRRISTDDLAAQIEVGLLHYSSRSIPFAEAWASSSVQENRSCVP
jgi:hypothetical protein